MPIILKILNVFDLGLDRFGSRSLIRVNLPRLTEHGTRQTGALHSMHNE